MIQLNVFPCIILVNPKHCYYLSVFFVFFLTLLMLCFTSPFISGFLTDCFSPHLSRIEESLPECYVCGGAFFLSIELSIIIFFIFNLVICLGFFCQSTSFLKGQNRRISVHWSTEGWDL